MIDPVFQPVLEEMQRGVDMYEQWAAEDEAAGRLADMNHWRAVSSNRRARMHRFRERVELLSA